MIQRVVVDIIINYYPSRIEYAHNRICYYCPPHLIRILSKIISVGTRVWEGH